MRPKTLQGASVTPIDGANPQAGLIVDSDGNLYGTTVIGGGSGCGGMGCGTVFKLSPGGTESVLHSFTGSNVTPIDGAIPDAGLLADSNGNLFGTTQNGGASGNGVVFKLAPGGTLTVLHSFTGSKVRPIDGATPVAGLIAREGNLYGTTDTGGASGFGVVFKLTGAGFR